jgi:hypothetical protein
MRSMEWDGFWHTLHDAKPPVILTRHEAPTWKDKIHWPPAEASFWSQTLVSWRHLHSLHVSRLWDRYTSLTDHQTVARRNSQTQTSELSRVWTPKNENNSHLQISNILEVKLTEQIGLSYVKLTNRISLNPRHSSYTTFLMWGTSVKILRGLTQRKIISNWAPEFGGTFLGIQHRNTRLTCRHRHSI